MDKLNISLHYWGLNKNIAYQSQVIWNVVHLTVYSYLLCPLNRWSTLTLTFMKNLTVSQIKLIVIPKIQKYNSYSTTTLLKDTLRPCNL